MNFFGRGHIVSSTVTRPILPPSLTVPTNYTRYIQLYTVAPITKRVRVCVVSCLNFAVLGTQQEYKDVRQGCAARDKVRQYNSKNYRINKRKTNETI